MIINNGNVQDAITNFVDFNPADFIKYKIDRFPPIVIFIVIMIIIVVMIIIVILIIIIDINHHGNHRHHSQHDDDHVDDQVQRGRRPAAKWITSRSSPIRSS